MSRSRHQSPSRDYIELRARSAFSFLEGASNPEDLVERAAELGYSALALGDRNGVYGIPRFHQAAHKAGLRAIPGARLSLGDPAHSPSTSSPSHPPSPPSPPPPPSLLLLPESPLGWRRLCRLITLGHRGRAKGESQISWHQLEEHARDLTVLIRGDASLNPDLLDRAVSVFASGQRPAAARRGRLWVDVSRHLDPEAERIGRRAAHMAEAAGVPVVASGDVRCALPEDRKLLDAFTCLRCKTALDTAGRRLLKNGEHHLRGPSEMAARFADRPEWVRATRAVAERCDFTLANLGYRFPRYPVAEGRSQACHLRELTLLGARERYGHPLPSRVRHQILHELAVIEKLDLAGYFLIVHDITRHAREHGILCQGRGSAANSAVCYSLGITAVDPVGMELLFERFLSEERGEWPDIDLDLPSGDRREQVIQYVFGKYGPHGAAMTANVITYRTRMAVREMGKVMGMAPESIDRLSKMLSSLEHNDALDPLAATLRDAGVDPNAPRVAQLLELVSRVRGLPRHLGQHSGGVVIAADRLDEVVPIEPASMQGRCVVQWDKEDCADLGIIKIDLLGLGMLAALEQTLPLVRRYQGVTLDLAHLPPDDPETYAMIRRADTIGTFQIESRAQMATLPRMKPTCFYDLVVEIGIIRPGPIVGDMVHPYLRRRAGHEPVTYPHPSLEPILKRTLGIPIFQEQLLRLAMTAAGFTGGEAEELRRAMGFKRSAERMRKIETRLRQGMSQRGLSAQAQQDIQRYITAFAQYGFPESHSASFALIAYASAFLKRHHPAAFLVGLLNAYPMGFYGPATLIKDAQRHGVGVHPIDVVHSHWPCTLEAHQTRVDEPTRPAAPPSTTPPPAVRVGLRYASRLRQSTAQLLVAERERRPFRDLADLAGRVAFHRGELDTLAELGALASLPGGGAGRRAALWQVAALERDPTSLFAGIAPAGDARSAEEDPGETPGSPLREMTPFETTLADYRLSGLTTGPQLLAHLRPALERRGISSARELRDTPNGRFVRTAGHVIVRQRPSSAKNLCFLTLEDETGTANAILTPRQFQRFRAALHNAAAIEIAGPLQRVDDVIHVRVRHLTPLTPRGELPEGRNYR
jgi:error-prone DNA polymerase